MKSTTTEKKPAARQVKFARSREFMLLSGAMACAVLLLPGCKDDDDKVRPPDPTEDLSMVQLPDGFKIEKVVTGLTYPTALTWDAQGKLYVVEAGGGLDPTQLAASRLLRIENGNATEVVNLTGRGVGASVTSLEWHSGNFYISHRDDGNLTGAVSRVSPQGMVTNILTGIVASQSEHQVNDLRMGPDGKMYLAVGLPGNAGVVTHELAPWFMKSPNLKPVPCQDIRLVGRNFKTPDPRTSDPNDSVLTGAYVPFGTATQPGQLILGTNKCGGSILKFDPNNAEGTLQVHAWGFRNPIGLAWNQGGEMYMAENGYDVRGGRPVKDEFDATLKIMQGEWYGIPDFSAAREPLTDPKFRAPLNLMAPVFNGQTPIGKELGFVIDHAASGLTPPNPSRVVGKHAVDSSPCMLDVAPASWGQFAGHLIVAEWGDLAPPTNPLLNGKPGYKLVSINPATKELKPFVQNRKPGPASLQGGVGKGLERPFGIRFGPDGAMYIVDYGVVTIDFTRKPPYSYQVGTGVIWKVSKK